MLGHEPASSASRAMVQWSTISPSLAAGMAKRALGSATRRSHAIASCEPAPSTAPCTAAIVGTGTVASASRASWSVPTKAASSTPVRSAPEQKCGPAPARTSARAPPSGAARTIVASCSQWSWSNALRRSGRSSTTTVTAPRRSMWITAGPLVATAAFARRRCRRRPSWPRGWRTSSPAPSRAPCVPCLRHRRAARPRPVA